MAKAKERRNTRKRYQTSSQNMKRGNKMEERKNRWFPWEPKEESAKKKRFVVLKSTQ